MFGRARGTGELFHNVMSTSTLDIRQAVERRLPPRCLRKRNVVQASNSCRGTLRIPFLWQALGELRRKGKKAVVSLLIALNLCTYFCTKGLSYFDDLHICDQARKNRIAVRNC